MEYKVMCLNASTGAYNRVSPCFFNTYEEARTWLYDNYKRDWKDEDGPHTNLIDNGVVLSKSIMGQACVYMVREA